MVVRVLGHREADGDNVEERALDLRSEAVEILADVKDQLERAEVELVALAGQREVFGFNNKINGPLPPPT